MTKAEAAVIRAAERLIRANERDNGQDAKTLNAVTSAQIALGKAVERLWKGRKG